MQLVPGMFATRQPGWGRLFEGQIRNHPAKITHNAGWYNSAGIKIGWGDLDVDDLQVIRTALAPTERWIVVGEADYLWRSRDAGLNPEAPGLDFLAQYIRYMVTPMGIYHTAQSDVRGNGWEQCGVYIQDAPHDWMRAVIMGASEYGPARPSPSFLKQRPFCTVCDAPEMHPAGDRLLVRGFKVDNYSQCLVCSGYYDANWNETPANHDPEKGWF